MQKLKVCILGTGNIGTDLLIKILRSKYLKCTLFAGRNLQSKGMSKALNLNVPLSDKGINAIIQNPDCCDLVFDATSAKGHLEHAPILKKLGKISIDLTPAKIGIFVVPSVNIKDSIAYNNLNMVTCGGQASIPIVYAISQVVKNIEYIEVVSTIASRSAGPGTRINIDEYVETTKNAISHFSKCDNVKAIINLNPAIPSIDMRTTIYMKVKNANINEVQKSIDGMVDNVKSYVAGYNLIVKATYIDDIIMLTLKVYGMGDYLPKYAGNLDIINCAAIKVAENIAKNKNNEYLHE